MRSSLITVVLLLLMGAGAAQAHSNYTGYSGAPGRQTCANSCHGGSNGTVTVTGFPELYTPGTPYSITIARSSGNSIRNFNGSCRLGMGTSNAGVLSGGQGTSTYSVNGETNGIHLSSNSQNSATFTWTAPAAGAGPARLYIGAYQGSNANGQTTELTLISEEGTAGEPELALVEVSVVSDDDGDGLAEAGETVGLVISLENTGTIRINNPTGVLGSASPDVQMIQPESDWPDIPQGQTRQNNTPFGLVVNPDLAADETIVLTLQVTSDEGVFDLEGGLDLHWIAPLPPDVAAVDPVVVSDGDGDGAAEPGENIQLSVVLVNQGEQELTGIEAVLAASSPWVEVTGAAGGFPNLSPAESAVVLAPFTVQFGGDAPPLYDEGFALHITCDQGEGLAVFTLPVGARTTVWSDDLESGEGDWSHAAAADWGDQWHLAEASPGSPVHAWKCGDAGDGAYDDHLDARLVSPPVALRPWSRLEFSHSMQAEVSGAYPDSAYDGGVVEISLDDGASWEQLTPMSGYTHSFRFLTGAGNPTTHPFPGGTPCFSGSLDWGPVRIDLGAFGTAAVRFRFRFGSDNGTGHGGWVIDDLRVVGLAEDTDLPPAARPADLDLLAAWPNPFNPATRVSLDLAAAGPARLELYDLAGRRVRTLLAGNQPAGRRELVLDGAGLAGGCYLLRLETPRQSRALKLLLVR